MMAKKKKVHVFIGNRFLEEPAVVCVGAGYYDGAYASADVLAGHFSGVSTFDEFAQRLSRVNGFYVIVSVKESEIYAATDRVRSIPLFYAVTKEGIFLSDNPQWIVGELGGVTLDRFSAGEFLLTGYVTGPHTLVNGVNQLQAGEAVSFSSESEKNPLEAKRYYRFAQSHGSEKKENLMQQLDVVVKSAIERLIRFADGRLIAIPLSGGFDSRLIALKLKQFGYSAVTTFSYGKPENRESRISQKVASALGFQWTFVPYSETEWQEWYKSNEMGSYIKFAERLTSEALVQDWPAIKKLSELGILGKDSVVVPGHTGDFLSGGHIPLEAVRFFNLARLDFWRVVRRHHYHLTTFHWAAKRVGLHAGQLAKELRGRFQVTDGARLPQTRGEALEWYSCWEWQERQAKFIVNSVRAYEFFGLSWWLPWWDAEVLAFWEKVPFELLNGRQFYKDYVRSVEASLEIDMPEFVSPSRRSGEMLNGLTFFLWPAASEILRGQYRRLASLTGSLDRSYSLHSLATTGVVDLEIYRNILRDGGNVNTILAALQIERWLTNERKQIHSL
jgi:asparagine synthase (glutamine-hydrolysing)